MLVRVTPTTAYDALFFLERTTLARSTTMQPSKDK